MLPDPVEQQRCKQRGEQPAQGAAGRHDQVEQRQLRRIRAGIIEPGVQGNADHKQQEHAADHRGQRGRIAGRRGKPASNQHEQRRHLCKDPRQHPVVGKGNAEAEQVEPQRDHPQQRHREEIGGEMRCGGQHQPRRYGGKHQPQRNPAPTDSRHRRIGLLRQGCLRRLAAAPGTEADQYNQQRIAQAPANALLGCR